MVIKNNKKNIPLKAIILAGGKSSRIGQNKNKARIKLFNKSLIEWVILKLTSIENLSEEDIIIVGPKEKYPQFKHVVEDIFPQKGPLGGIFSGLKASDSQYNLVVGCDMPLLEVELLQYMCEGIDSNDIVIPRYKGYFIEPLCAVYSKRCLEVMEKNIQSGILSVRKIFPYLKIRYINDEEIKRFDPKFYSFFNINFKNDFKKAKEYIISKKGFDN
ncbi:MAG: molybdenum cofactor guanylyltransferase [Candidatus Caldatribacteriota bacterium]|nr:molybdenum cofactor guanylyltransferase [Candidatus Caldatribacteriota bacterium]